MKKVILGFSMLLASFASFAYPCAGHGTITLVGAYSVAYGGTQFQVDGGPANGGKLIVLSQTQTTGIMPAVGKVASWLNGETGNDLFCDVTVPGATATISEPPVTHGWIFERIDYPGGLTTEVRGINDLGDIVGNSDTHGFIRYSDGTFEAFSCPGTLAVYPYSVNNYQQVIGHAMLPNAANTLATFTWDAATKICTVSNKRASMSTYHNDNNDVGQVVGYTNATGPAFAPKSFGPAGVIKPVGATYSRAEGINNVGQVVGFSAFKTAPRTRGWTLDNGVFTWYPVKMLVANNDYGALLSMTGDVLINGVWSVIPAPPDSFGVWFNKINNANVVVGTFRNSPTEYKYSGFVAHYE